MAGVVANIIHGNVAQQARGYLLTLPPGCSGRKAVSAEIEAFYGVAHPDLRILDPDGKSINVDDIRGVNEFLASSSMSGKIKTLLVVDAHRMNYAAANAFLKSLEEPSKSTRIILTTDAPWLLPATVLSRCVKHRVEFDDGDLRDELSFALVSDASADHTEALKASGCNPRIAAEVIQYNLVDWTNNVRKWLSKPAPKLPEMPSQGKEHASLPTIFALLERVLVDAATGQTPIAGWNIDKSEKSLKIITEMAIGINRPGMDWQARLKATLLRLAYS